MKKYLLLIFCLFVFVISAQEQQYIAVKRTVNLMSVNFQITVVVLDSEIGFINIAEAAAEIKRIEALISPLKEDSETSLVNNYAGIKPVQVSREFFEIVERATHYAAISKGSFDITDAVLDDLWRFDGTMKYMPVRSEVEKLLPKINYKSIVLNKEKQTVFLENEGMKISFKAIAKGYILDKVKELLISKQVKGGMIKASGVVTSWGTKISGKKWMLGLENSENIQKSIDWFPLIESSASTSNLFEKYINSNNHKYSYILNPKTGYPVEEINRVTIFSKKAELSDTLATTLFVMGKEEGLALINQIPNTEAIILGANNVIYKSSGLK